MTREEAIARVKHQRDWANEVNRMLDVEAFDMAIKALEHESTTKNNLGVDWESYKDVDGNSLDDLILEVLQNNFDCGNTYGYKVADEIIGLLPSVTPQEPTLDKIREEIGKAWHTKPKNRYEEGLKDQALKDMQIIDKYNKSEVEDEKA